MRLNRYLAQSGFGSRRAVEALVAQGAVKINGRPADHPGNTVDETKDRVEVNGQPVHPPQTHVYILMNKPRGYDVTRGGEHHHRRAWDLLPAGTHASVQSVGRLDRDSTGLLLFTNDGELAFRLTHPRYGCAKVYEVEVEGQVSHAGLEGLRRGVELDDGPARAVAAEILGNAGGNTVLKITMAEGRKRIVRRMCDAIGHEVIALNRVAVGPLTLTGVAKGKTRELRPAEVAKLKKSVGLAEEKKEFEPRRREDAKKTKKKKFEPQRRRETEKPKPKFKPPRRQGRKD